jgi:MscS family membrane protein
MNRPIRIAVLALLLATAGVAAAQTETPTLRDVIQNDRSPDAPEEEAAQAPQTPAVAADAETAPGEPAVHPPPPAEVGETPRATVRAFLDDVSKRDYERAAATLDLSRASVGSEEQAATLARQLEVVLDRTLWIDLDALSADPDGNPDDGLAPNRDRVGDIALGDRRVSILLEKVPTAEGPQWRFAASTVAMIPRLYEEYGYGPLGKVLPDFFFDLRLLDIQLWQWLGLMVVVLVAGILSWALASVAASLLRLLLQRGSEGTSERVVAVVTGPARLAIGVAIFSAAKHLLGLAIPVNAVLAALESLVFIVAVTWAVLRLVDVFSSLVEEQLRQRSQDSAVTLLAPGRKTLKIFTVAIAFIALLHSLGFNVTALLAGLGVGGIAVALAAQKTVENLFGGVTLYADRPVRVGDFCRFGDKIGTIEEIGIRSTRVRTLDRTVVSVPNAEFSNLQLENFNKRDKIWYHPRIGLRYETTPDQLRYVLVEVRKMLYAHPKVDPDPARIRFVNFGAYSLDLDIFAYVDVSDYGQYLEVAEDLNLRIMDIVEEAGSSFAFPSQTTYLEQGQPLDERRSQSVSDRVQGWREERTLYLPGFPEAKVAELRNTLDFPPKGSPFAEGGR